LLLFAVLLMQRKKEAIMRLQINRLNEQLEMLKTASSEKPKDREVVIQSANTIYLTAYQTNAERQSGGAG
ncbi:MAG: hypothetical protein IKD01_03495, partial [Oscillospiraceae bacterium]|nr:hypothetical protein [Oscillospiraceae bacterium]